MIKLITQLITLSFCLPLFSLMQSTLTNDNNPFYFQKDKTKKEIKVINVGELNSVNQDYCPVILGDGILFTSDRAEVGSLKTGDANFYFSSQSSSGEFERPKLYSKILNSEFQEGMAAISPDGMTIVFSRSVGSITNGKSLNDVRLFSASWENNEWVNVKKMDINLEDYSSGHPAFSPDGNELYFVSNRPGGFGATDVYVSKLIKGKWSKPENLGDRINTPTSELFPYLDNGGTLYFSSNKSGGNGLLDIYETKKQISGNWDWPTNLGVPFNSEKNDFGFYKTKNGNAGYLSSNREGGMGGNDIYAWGSDLEDSEVSSSTTKIYILEETSETPISNAKVIMKDAFENLTEWSSDKDGKIEIDASVLELNLLTIEHKDFKKKLFDPSLLEKDIEVFSIKLSKESCANLSGHLVDENGNAILLDQTRVEISNLSTRKSNQIYTDRNGMFEFCLKCNADFSIKAFPKGFYLGEVKVTTKNINCSNEEPINIQVAMAKISEEDQLKANQNLSNASQGLSPEEVVIRNAKNKSMLESISIAEEENEEFDLEIEEAIGTTETTEVEKKNERPNNSFYSIPNIYYDFDSYKIKDTDKKYLEDLAVYLKENPDLKLSIKSFTDTKGRKAYNKWLSKRRAQAVMEHLMMKGVEKNRLDAKGKGELELANQSEADLDDAEKRRTEFEIVKIPSAEVFLDSYSNHTNDEIKTEVYISNIYYDFNSHLLNGSSSDEVDKLVEQLNQYPNLKIEVRSHTDARGTSEYNKWLSQKRANEVVRYIKSKGIEAARLKAIGFGESELLNNCADGVTCSKEKHAENRRTEFVFL